MCHLLRGFLSVYAGCVCARVEGGDVSKEAATCGRQREQGVRGHMSCFPFVFDAAVLEGCVCVK